MVHPSLLWYQPFGTISQDSTQRYHPFAQYFRSIEVCLSAAPLHICIPCTGDVTGSQGIRDPVINAAFYETRTFHSRRDSIVVEKSDGKIQLTSRLTTSEAATILVVQCSALCCEEADPFPFDTVLTVTL